MKMLLIYVSCCRLPASIVLETEMHKRKHLTLDHKVCCYTGDQEVLMVEQLITTPQIPTGKVIAEGVSFDDYMVQYAGEHCEWVRGYVK